MMIAGRSIENLLLPFHRMGQQCWLEEHRRQSHVIRIGDRWPDTLATHPPASLKVACVQIRASTGCVRAPLDTVPLRKRNGTSRRGRPWRLFACVTPASLLTLQPPDNFAIDAMDHAGGVCRWAWGCRSRRWCRNRRMGWDRDRAWWTQRLASRSPGPMSALARIVDSSRTSREVRKV